MGHSKERGTCPSDSRIRLGHGDCLILVRLILGAFGGNLRETSRTVIHEGGNGEDRTLGCNLRPASGVMLLEGKTY